MFITARKRSLRRLCFYTCLTFCSRGGLPQCMLGYHPPGKADPPGKETSPDKADPPDKETPLRSACSEICILLECDSCRLFFGLFCLFFTHFCFHSYFSFGVNKPLKVCSQVTSFRPFAFEFDARNGFHGNIS